MKYSYAFLSIRDIELNREPHISREQYATEELAIAAAKKFFKPEIVGKIGSVPAKRNSQITWSK